LTYLPSLVSIILYNKLFELYKAEYINKEYLVMVINVWIHIRRNTFLNCVWLIATYAHRIFKRM